MYQVWTREIYQDLWALNEVDSLQEVEKIIRENFGKDIEVKVSLPVSFEARIAVKVDAPREPAPTRKIEQPVEISTKEETEVATEEGGPEEDKGPRGKSHKPVR
ncbi:MAG: hypothetical protein KKB38_20345 [Gammaproteobacteria bacterium]|nr:hypothetical protein [Gammaproteobacteria bacterium]